MAYIPPETVAQARQVDLLTYMKACEPEELVHISGNHYCTREHDSLKISNGKWYCFSRGFGGYNALDYLIKVKEIPFTTTICVCGWDCPSHIGSQRRRSGEMLTTLFFKLCLKL